MALTLSPVEMTMSSAVDRGFDFRESHRISWVPAQTKVVDALQLDVYISYRQFVVPESMDIAMRPPEFDSHAIAACSSSGVTAVGLISVYDPKALPSHIHALISESVRSPPTSPITSLPVFDASSINEYWMSVAWPVSPIYCSALHDPPMYVLYAMSLVVSVESTP